MKKIKKLLVCLFVGTLSFLSLEVHTERFVIPFDISKDVSIVPYADDIRWVYITMNGKRYRRKYNYSRQCWIGEWELVS